MCTQKHSKMCNSIFYSGTNFTNRLCRNLLVRKLEAGLQAQSAVSLPIILPLYHNLNLHQMFIYNFTTLQFTSHKCSSTPAWRSTFLLCIASSRSSFHTPCTCRSVQSWRICPPSSGSLPHLEQLALKRAK